MGTSDLNFYINKHRKAYEERLNREQQNQQGKPSEGEPGREVEKAPPSEVTNGGANEQPIETDSRSKNPNEEFSQHASQSDATRNSTREEHMNQGELLWEETNEGEGVCGVTAREGTHMMHTLCALLTAQCWSCRWSDPHLDSCR